MATDNSVAMWIVMQFKNTSLYNLTYKFVISCTCTPLLKKKKKKANNSVSISQEHGLWFPCNLVKLN